jgi:hypothetical protein
MSALSRLLDATALQAAVRVRPLRLDRLGLVLRVERLRGHTDLRLPFTRPVSSPAWVGPAIADLLEQAGRVGCRRFGARP